MESNRCFQGILRSVFFFDPSKQASISMNVIEQTNRLNKTWHDQEGNKLTFPTSKSLVRSTLCASEAAGGADVERAMT